MQSGFCFHQCDRCSLVTLQKRIAIVNATSNSQLGNVFCWVMLCSGVYEQNSIVNWCRWNSIGVDDCIAERASYDCRCKWTFNSCFLSADILAYYHPPVHTDISAWHQDQQQQHLLIFFLQNNSHILNLYTGSPTHTVTVRHLQNTLCTSHSHQVFLGMTKYANGKCTDTNFTFTLNIPSGMFHTWEKIKHNTT